MLEPKKAIAGVDEMVTVRALVGTEEGKRHAAAVLDLAAVTALLLLLFLPMAGDEEAGVLTLEQTEFAASPAALWLVWHNVDGDEFSYAEEARLERKNGLSWVEVPAVQVGHGHEVTVPPDISAARYYNLSWRYGVLEPGNYRLCVRCRLGRETRTVFAPFTVVKGEEQSVLSLKQTAFKESPTVLDAVWENDNEAEGFYYGEVFWLEQKQSSKWTRLPTYDDIAFPLPAYELLPGASADHPYGLSWCYDVLEPGAYRFVSSYGLGKADLLAYAEFSVG